MTGFGGRDRAIGELQLGAFDLLEKPIRQEVLYHPISRALTALNNEREIKWLIYDDHEQSRLELLAHQLRLAKLRKNRNAYSNEIWKSCDARCCEAGRR